MIRSPGIDNTSGTPAIGDARGYLLRSNTGIPQVINDTGRSLVIGNVSWSLLIDDTGKPLVTYVSGVSLGKR